MTSSLDGAQEAGQKDKTPVVPFIMFQRRENK